MFFGTGAPVFRLWRYHATNQTPDFIITLPTPAGRTGNPFQVEIESFRNPFGELIEIERKVFYKDQIVFKNVEATDYANMCKIANWRGAVTVEPWGTSVRYLVKITDFKAGDRMAGVVLFNEMMLQLESVNDVGVIPDLDNLIIVSQMFRKALL